MAASSEAITTAFEQGNGIDFPLESAEAKAMHAELTVVGAYLAQLSIESSFAWSEQAPTRHSCWLASAPDGSFIVDDEGLAAFDGDANAGKRGLELLQQAEPALLDALQSLKTRADQTLTLASQAIGISTDYAKKCGTRYRVIRYDQNENGGIGLHFDGNALSVVQTNAPGLQEYRYDGTTHKADYQCISLMPGSSLHRASITGNSHPILPTFHDVQMNEGQHKTSMAAFWNLPDKSYIPATLLGTGFYHDVGIMKNDDGPHGSLAYLWRQIATVHPRLMTTNP